MMACLTQSASFVKVAVPTARKTTARRAAVKVQANMWPVSFIFYFFENDHVWPDVSLVSLSLSLLVHCTPLLRLRRRTHHAHGQPFRWVEKGGVVWKGV
jgi:hypothetical protein